MDTVIEGKVQRIRYSDGDTFWTIATVGVVGGEVTIVGTMPGLQAGMNVRCDGRVDNHAKYGKQFRVERWVELVPATKKGLTSYLASGFVAGIGPSFAKRIVEHFGTETLAIIRDTPERLAEVPGIGKKRSVKIVSALQERRGPQEALIFLMGLGMTRGMAMRIYRRYGDDSVSLVRREPFKLAEDVHGIGFHRADQVARGLNIAHDALGRLRAGVYHCLRVARDDGHSFLWRPTLIAAAAELLKVDESMVTPALSALAADGKVALSHPPGSSGDEAVYLPKLYAAEHRASKQVATFLSRPPRHVDDRDEVKASIAEAATSLGLELADGQTRAVQLAFERGFVVVTGGPGTGKTTLVRTLLKAVAADIEERRIALAAPTGRAAKRLSEATGQHASTIHRLLEFSPREGRFQRDADAPLDIDLIVVDEASMIDLQLFDALVRAIPSHARVVLVGDSDQLPPVGPGSPLLDLLSVEHVPVARLDRIFRQGEGSAIVDAAHAINSGQPIAPTPPGTPLQDFYFIERDDPDDIRAMMEHLVSERIPERFGLDSVADVQVLTPMRTGAIGVDRLNTALRDLLNPGDDDTETALGFRVGDKVMQIRNDYDRSVFNGDMGYVERVDPKRKTLLASIDQRPVLYEAQHSDDLVLAYAVTVHKSQGSEYPAVVMPVSTQHFKMLRRNLLYTGVTRGKRLVVLVGTPRAMKLCVSARDEATRFSGLAARLRHEMERPRDE